MSQVLKKPVGGKFQTRRIWIIVVAFLLAFDALVAEIASLGPLWRPAFLTLVASGLALCAWLPFAVVRSAPRRRAWKRDLGRWGPEFRFAILKLRNIPSRTYAFPPKSRYRPSLMLFGWLVMNIVLGVCSLSLPRDSFMQWFVKSFVFSSAGVFISLLGGALHFRTLDLTVGPHGLQLSAGADPVWEADWGSISEIYLDYAAQHLFVKTYGGVRRIILLRAPLIGGIEDIDSLLATFAGVGCPLRTAYANPVEVD